MARRLDYGRATARSRIARNGSENIRGDAIPLGLAPPSNRTSKEDQRAALAAAIAAITRTVKCAACGHSASLTLPVAKAHRRLRCSRCGAVARS